MDAVIVAGGRGKRMGALTDRKNKGALSYRRKPLIVHVIERMLILGKRIDTIYIATDYQSTSVQVAVERPFEAEIEAKKICLVSTPHITGGAKRLAYIANTLNLQGPCFVCGIEVLYPHLTAKRFIDSYQSAKDVALAMLVSPDLNVAPRHSRVRVEKGFVTGYASPTQVSDKTSRTWCTYMGSFLFFPEFLAEVRAAKLEERGVIQCCPLALQRSRVVSAHRFTGKWIHFGRPSDFSKTL